MAFRFFLSILAWLLAGFGVAFAQTPAVYTAADAHADAAPKVAGQTVEALAAYLAQAGPADSVRVRAAYRWVTRQVAYDVNTYLQFGQSGVMVSTGNGAAETRLAAQKADRVLQSRMAVCQGYSNLMAALCKEMDIPAEVVAGYNKGITYQQSGRIALNHAWNVVQVGGRWRPLDATWGAGVVEGRRYVPKYSEEFFLPAPDAFVQKHLPADPAYQLLAKPVRFADFTRATVPVDAALALPDTLNLMASLPDTVKAYRSNQRAARFYPENALPYLKLSEYHATKALGLFARFNDETKGFYRENLPATVPIKQLLTDIELHLNASRGYLQRISRSDANMHQIAQSSMKLIDSNLRVLDKTRAFWLKG